MNTTVRRHAVVLAHHPALLHPARTCRGTDRIEFGGHQDAQTSGTGDAGRHDRADRTRSAVGRVRRSAERVRHGVCRTCDVSRLSRGKHERDDARGVREARRVSRRSRDVPRGSARRRRDGRRVRHRVHARWRNGSVRVPRDQPGLHSRRQRGQLHRGPGSHALRHRGRRVAELVHQRGYGGRRHW